MSLKIEKGKYDEYEFELEEPLNLKSAVLSFTKFKEPEKFIYNGQEKIPFCKRHPLYRSIFIHEFIDHVKKISKRGVSTHFTF